ncbi:MAG: hypothetical protein LC808_14935 [Actinobacteria bacterium]|nr:hypothetical protein [Actinomycetota bacterium]
MNYHLVTRSTRWALSKQDFCVHLVAPPTEPRASILIARCGHPLPPGTHQHDQPPPGPPCERCRLIFLADFSSHRQPTH